MRAEVLVPRAAAPGDSRSPFYTYRVPERLASLILPGQLVAVPFGERMAAGLVWALDASDEAGAGPNEPVEGLRLVANILLQDVLLLPAQRALAEWLADHYATTLGSAARLLLPPGLLRGLRTVLRPAGEGQDAAPRESAAAMVSGDAAIVLGMLRERGWLNRDELERTFGPSRAAVVTRALRAHKLAALGVELPGTQAGTRRERVVRLAGAAEVIAAWREVIRARLDTLPPPPLRRARQRRGDPGEREAERLLRQLAVVDVLSRPARGASAAENGGGWRIEDLRRLTRATAGALAEMERAGLIAIADVELRHDPLAGRTIARNEPLPLTPPQRDALAAILRAGEEEPHVVLLHGITGSGKTEVYLQALAAVLARGQRGIVLVPEIALTPQAMARFAGRFPGRVALLHSGLTDAERLDEWRRIHTGQVDVVVGSRSALFAPMANIGLIVVDEEHETAYKQEHAPTYHARDAAAQLGRLTGAAVVLGSATPSVESYWLAQQGIYRLVELRERAPVGVSMAKASNGVEGHAPSLPPGLPPVTIVDLRAELRAGNTSILSEKLQAALQDTLHRGEQAILFLNRRGMASAIICRECGFALRCLHCDVSMTLHAGERAVICHYCGRRQPVPATCPNCWSASIRYFGLGTERVEAAVKRQFPAARVLRWDRDTAKTRQTHESLLRAFTERRADVLVGTQMIAKGLDLPAVTLVGVVSADVALFLPDFRASERAFQLLTQVAGRAGRGERPGRVLVQTLNPEHFCIETAARHDYPAFFAAEVSARGRYGYPPFRRFVKCTYEHRDRYSAQIEATMLGERLEKLIAELALPDTDIVGPAPAFLERLRGRYRWQIIVRSPDPRPLLRALAPSDLPRGWSIDVDPATSL
jgi:primosomal protein N' (replication factor Y) (superfamily II helicase)